MLNTRRGPFADLPTLRGFVRVLIPEKQAASQVGRLGILAWGMIRPGPLGYEAERSSSWGCAASGRQALPG